MKKGVSRSVKVGAYGLSMAILLYLGINFIKSKKLFSGDNTFYVEYSQADGIEVSSPVLIKGFKVGTVDKISFDIEKSTVIVTMAIDNEYPIPNDSKAKITSTGLLGGQIIEIALGKSDIPYPNKAYITSLQDVSILKFAGDEYNKLKEGASSLIDQLTKVLKGVNGVLSDENVSSLSGTLANLNSMSQNLNSVINNQQSSIEGLLTNLNNVSNSLNNRLVPKLDSTLSNIQTLSTSLSTDAPALLANASQAVNNLNNVLAKIDNSQGTLGKLVNDQEVYSNLADATKSLTLLLEDIKENPRRYVSISVFGGKNKAKK